MRACWAACRCAWSLGSVDSCLGEALRTGAVTSGDRANGRGWRSVGLGDGAGEMASPASLASSPSPNVADPRLTGASTRSRSLSIAGGLSVPGAGEPGLRPERQWAGRGSGLPNTVRAASMLVVPCLKPADGMPCCGGGCTPGCGRWPLAGAARRAFMRTLAIPSVREPKVPSSRTGAVPPVGISMAWSFRPSCHAGCGLRGL